MTIVEFAKLTVDQQMDAVWEWGFYLGKFRGQDRNKVLYALNGFFAEVDMSLPENKVLAVAAYSELSQEVIQRYGLKESNPFLRFTGFPY